MLARITTLAALLLPLLLTACSDSSDSNGFDPAARLAEITDFESYDWQEISAGPRWEPRAGLQALA
jgi:ABC-type oligopeptide transport system substrate-binding subunit